MFTGTGNIEGETYEAPVAYLTHMVAQRQDTTQWLLKFMTSYSGTTGSHALKAGKYKMSLKFNHNIETKNPAIYDIAIPEAGQTHQNYSDKNCNISNCNTLIINALDLFMLDIFRIFIV